MQEGYLKIGVLKILSQKERSGYDLMKQIEMHIGKKPSSGSMYPLLKDLQKQQLITAHDRDRSTVYSLTAKGKNHLKELLTHRREIMERMHQNLSFMEHICGERQPGIHKIFEKITEGKIPFGPYTKSLTLLRDTVFLANEKDLAESKKKHITDLLTKTTKEIKTLCSK